MPRLRRGDIVLADLPFSDASGSKVRPGLVVQNDANNRRLDDVILALNSEAGVPVLLAEIDVCLNASLGISVMPRPMLANPGVALCVAVAYVSTFGEYARGSAFCT